jgi:hypothetical protein
VKSSLILSLHLQDIHTPCAHTSFRDVLLHCMEHSGVNLKEALENDPLAFTDNCELRDLLKLCYNSLITTGDNLIADSMLLDVIRQVCVGDAWVGFGRDKVGSMRLLHDTRNFSILFPITPQSSLFVSVHNPPCPSPLRVLPWFSVHVCVAPHARAPHAYAGHHLWALPLQAGHPPGVDPSH